MGRSVVLFFYLHAKEIIYGEDFSTKWWFGVKIVLRVGNLASQATFLNYWNQRK